MMNIIFDKTGGQIFRPPVSLKTHHATLLFFFVGAFGAFAQ